MISALAMAIRCCSPPDIREGSERSRPTRHLYQILERLGRDGLIASERQPQPVKPDRVVHHLTPAGRAELDHWLSEPSPRIRGYRDDFFLKLMAAVQTGDPATLAGVLRRQRTHLLKELHSLADARTHAPSAVVSLLITAAELHVRADLGVVDAAEQSLEPELAAGKRRSALAGRREAGRPGLGPGEKATESAIG